MTEDNAVINVGNWGKDYFGTMIYTSPTSGVLSMNFEHDDDNYALHYNPRYDEQAIVINSKVNGEWLEEERPPGFPFGSGQDTQIVAVVKDQFIDIFANKGTFSHQYRQQYDATKVNKIHCKGYGTPVKALVGRALYQYEVGKVVYIKVTAPTAGKAFAIDFLPSLPRNYDYENIAFHMKFWLNANYVVRNTKINGQWGQEEKGELRIQPGEAFNIIVVAQKEGYEVALNGAHFCKYKYRVPLSKETSVEVENEPFANGLQVERIDYY